MAGILDLPPELIAHIISYIDDTIDIFNSRLSNKHIESATLSHFGKRFFRKKGYLITTPSINVLKSIANHTELRKHVQHVWFNPDCYTFVDPKCALEVEVDEGGDKHERVDLLSDDDRRRWYAFLECIKDHGRLLSKSQLAEDLTDAFSKLPNLAAVGMRRSEDHSPWGWHKLKETIGEDPRVLGPIPSGPKYALQGPTKLFTAIINAMAAANSNVQRLYTDIVEIDNILPENLSQETLDRACRSLLYLELNATKAWLNGRPNSTYSTLGSHEEWGRGLLRLFHAVPHLLELGLQIFPDLRQSHLLPPVSRSPESWKKVYPYIVFEKLTHQSPLEHLTRLKLEKLTITSELLIAFLTPSKSSLTSLKLRDIRLLSSETAPQPWYPVFNFLRDFVPDLSYLLLYHLMHHAGGISFVEDTPRTDDIPLAAAAASRERQFFTSYKNIVLEAEGRDAVKEELQKVAEKHWYYRPIFSYDMDEAAWHTDTSDEEW